MIMQSAFQPAIALMNLLSYTKKFMLLALISVAAFSMAEYTLFTNFDKDVRILQRELEGIALVSQFPKIVQLMQQHRGLSTGVLSGIVTMLDKRTAKKNEVDEAFHEIEAKLPPDLISNDAWQNIKTDWVQLQKKGLDLTQAECFTAHTHLIDQLLSFEVFTADEYRLMLNPKIESYYLIDTIVNELPGVTEQLAQLRAYGIANLADKRITEPEKTSIAIVISKLDYALKAFEVNIEKAARYNPSLQHTLLATSENIIGSAHQITGLVESDILTGRFTTSPESFYSTASTAIDTSYTEIHESLLSTAASLIKEKITGAKNTLYTSIGITLLLLLIVTYFAIGIYHSIIDSVRSLARSAGSFANGDMRERVHLDAHDELSQIGDSFNEMADSFNAMLAVHKRMSEDMQNSEIKFRTIYESSGDGIMLLDETGFLDCNEATLQIFGCHTRDDFINKHPSQLSPPIQPGGQASANLADEHIANAFRNGSDRFEWMHCRLNGAEFPAEVLLTSLELNGKQVLQASVRDITARKKIEETLRKSNTELEEINHQLTEAQSHLLQSEKMASIGQLAAGVAHEINNPIGYVYSNLGTLEKYVQDTFAMLDLYEQAESSINDADMRTKLKAARDKLDIAFLKEDLHALMDESKDGITRVKNIVQNLKDFSHRDVTDKWQYANLHCGLESTLNIVNNEIKYKANIIREYSDLPEVECLLSQINQVFMNLLVNAAHAIEERGTITIRTGRQDDEVWVEIADTGHGIAPEHLQKIFDPFFTTKPVGKGTGLGLSLSYGILQKHHGRIEVQSIVGRGTTFRMWLPIRKPQNEPA